MIDLAISVDDDPQGLTIVETNYGDRLTAPHWPQDSDFRLVAFSPTAKECAVIAPRELARDIALALEAAKPTLVRARKKPAWYYRLKKYSAGALDASD